MTTDTHTDTTRTSRLGLFRLMLTIREVEERSEKLFRDARVRGSMHLSTGQEAVSVGTCSVLQPDDALAFTYRSHAWAIARGISAEAVLAECFGRESGCSRGRGGSKHLSAWSTLRVFPSNAIVGGHLPMANGAALAAKRRGSGALSVAVFGDGALGEGAFHESVAQAVIWKLPTLFVCENNLYAELTPGHEMSPVGEDLYKLAAGYGMATVRCDGMDVDDVAAKAAEAAERARSGGGPTFIEAMTYRFCGHMTGDQQKYRKKEEVEEWRQRDPLKLFAERLAAEGLGSDELDSLRAEVSSAVAAAEQAAWDSPEPDPADILVGAPSWTTLER